MAERPRVAMVLPPSTYKQMFDTRILQPLTAVAEVVGPVEMKDRAAVARLLAGAQVAITGWGTPRLDAELLADASSLRLIAHSAGSVKGMIDPTVFERGIRVITAAGANADPVARFTVAMIQMMLKQVWWLASQSREPGSPWRGERTAQVRELQDIEVGLVGASRIGRLVIEMLRSFPRVKVRVFDPYLSAAAAEQLGVTRSTLEEVFGCTVVSIHAPKTPETHRMVDARLLGLLPDHAVLINTSRGALIDETALVAEVRRRPLYVLLDVTDPEPAPPDSPLRREPNILLTPHIAGAMSQARKDMGQLAIEETLRFLQGQPLQHEVTLEMLPTQA